MYLSIFIYLIVGSSILVLVVYNCAKMSGTINSSVEDVTILPPENTIPLENTAEENTTKNKSLCCDVCNIKVTSQKILQRHLEGRKHKLRSERRDQEYICEICELKANSQTQLTIHLNSSKHRARLIRKEYNEFTDVSKNSRALWVLIFCVFCICLNILILCFKSF